MRRRYGQVLLHILMGVGILITGCMYILNWIVHDKASRGRIERKENSVSSLEGARSRLWGCLYHEGYPGALSCSPTNAQKACTPAGFSADFVGTPQDGCRVLLTGL